MMKYCRKCIYILVVAVPLQSHAWLLWPQGLHARLPCSSIAPGGGGGGFVPRSCPNLVSQWTVSTRLLCPWDFIEFAYIHVHGVNDVDTRHWWVTSNTCECFVFFLRAISCAVNGFKELKSQVLRWICLVIHYSTIHPHFCISNHVFCSSRWLMWIGSRQGSTCWPSPVHLYFVAHDTNT